jgi:hypothetical protein
MRWVIATYEPSKAGGRLSPYELSILGSASCIYNLMHIHGIPTRLLQSDCSGVPQCYDCNSTVDP